MNVYDQIMAKSAEIERLRAENEVLKRREMARTVNAVIQPPNIPIEIAAACASEPEWTMDKDYQITWPLKVAAIIQRLKAMAAKVDKDRAALTRLRGELDEANAELEEANIKIARLQEFHDTFFDDDRDRELWESVIRRIETLERAVKSKPCKGPSCGAD